MTIGDTALAMNPFTFVGPDRIIVFSWGVPDQTQVVARLMTRAGEEIDSITAVTRGGQASVPIKLFGNQNRAFNVFADRPIREHSTNGEGVVIVHRPRPTEEGRAEFGVVRYLREEKDERRFTTSTQPLADYETDRLERIIDALYEQVGRSYGTLRSEIADLYYEALGSPSSRSPSMTRRSRTTVAFGSQPARIEKRCNGSG